MNARPIAIATATAASIACTAAADFVGWSATVRSVSGGKLVNVFAVTSSAGDRLVNVYGGRPSNPGHVQTNSPGGFLQGAGDRGVFKPTVDQSWDDADSFLTIGGAFDAGTGTWFANGSTAGDPGWIVGGAGGSSIDGFSALPAPGGPSNPWTNAVPTGAGWYLVGPGAASRDLASISAIRLAFSTVGSTRVGASSASAAAGAYGMLVAQLLVADLDTSRIQWKMGATILRSNGTVQQGEYDFTVGNVPVPGAVTLLGALGLVRRRRR